MKHGNKRKKKEREAYHNRPRKQNRKNENLKKRVKEGWKKIKGVRIVKKTKQENKRNKKKRSLPQLPKEPEPEE